MIEAHYIETDERVVYCGVCPRNLKYADIRLTIGRHVIQLCSKHAVEVALELLEDNSVYRSVKERVEL